MAKKDTFHSPFADVARELKKKMEAEAAAAEAQAKAAKQRPAPAKKAKGRDDDDDGRSFAELMAGTATLGHDPRGKQAAPASTEPRVVVDQRGVRDREDAEALATLASMVDGTGVLDEGEDEDSLEGWAPGLDRKIMRALRRGDYPPEATVDLHGQRQEKARDSVDRFLLDAHARGLRAVRIVHGRGLNSEDGQPVLKRSLKGWLTRGRATRLILAFCPAAPQDGGAGAVYVLLRR